ncbi:MAG: hypothetical protein D4R65_15365 [Verrucomicrobiaceae bacterium]|nr:MAG: hypothetical protein D4R65_15365 [Verrucomicrobiaceae bacterium]
MLPHTFFDRDDSRPVFRVEIRAVVELGRGEVDRLSVDFRNAAEVGQEGESALRAVGIRAGHREPISLGAHGEFAHIGHELPERAEFRFASGNEHHRRIGILRLQPELVVPARGTGRGVSARKRLHGQKGISLLQEKPAVALLEPIFHPLGEIDPHRAGLLPVFVPLHDLDVFVLDRLLLEIRLAVAQSHALRHDTGLNPRSKLEGVILILRGQCRVALIEILFRVGIAQLEKRVDEKNAHHIVRRAEFATQHSRIGHIKGNPRGVGLPDRGRCRGHGALFREAAGHIDILAAALRIARQFLHQIRQAITGHGQNPGFTANGMGMIGGVPPAVLITNDAAHAQPGIITCPVCAAVACFLRILIDPGPAAAAHPVQLADGPIRPQHIQEHVGALAQHRILSQIAHVKDLRHGVFPVIREELGLITESGARHKVFLVIPVPGIEVLPHGSAVFRQRAIAVVRKFLQRLQGHQHVAVVHHLVVLGAEDIRGRPGGADPMTSIAGVVPEQVLDEPEGFRLEASVPRTFARTEFKIDPDPVAHLPFDVIVAGDLRGHFRCPLAGFLEDVGVGSADVGVGFLQVLVQIQARPPAIDRGRVLQLLFKKEPGVFLALALRFTRLQGRGRMGCDRHDKQSAEYGFHLCF